VRRVLYTAAHGGFAGQAIPLGGGAAVANLLQEEWAGTRPFEVELLGPSILGAEAPGGEDLVKFSERQYAEFCRRFRTACTAEVLKHDVRETAVLVNDISEGPDFARLAGAGFRVVTVYHVDVVAYIAAIYLKARVAPETLTGIWEGLRRVGLAGLAPEILQLIFAQQRASLEHSAAVVVPSAGMKSILLKCYPAAPEGKIHVVPWGAPPGGPPGDGAALRREYGVEEGARVLLCLSRISPEKGQDTLLRALLEWEREGGPQGGPLWLFICGAPAFMHGERHMARLKDLAGRLKRIRVEFPGYVSGARKQAFLSMADLYVFPSRHESYGLTLMEALAAGLPAVCVEHQGSREIVEPAFGVMIGAGEGPRGLRREVERLLAAPERLREMGRAAREYAEARPFAPAARQVAELLVG
jgi:glycosyltransferase involved in cell wall biosynthesis